MCLKLKILNYEIKKLFPPPNSYGILITHNLRYVDNFSSGSRGGPGGPGPPLDPKFEAPDYILRPKLHLLTHK